jgi:hypothetical protein
MPSKPKLKIAVVPDDWKAAVIPLLDDGGYQKVIWTGRAKSNWEGLDDYGTRDRAHDHLIRQLSIPGLLGHDHPPMQDALDFSYCDTWAFLCPHPQGFPTPIYAKIAIHETHVRINLISLHIDLTKELEEAIQAYLAR